VTVITAASTLPVMELRPGLKDVRRPAALTHAYIVLSLLAGIRTEEDRTLHGQHVNLDGDLAASPPAPAHVAVWAIGARARRGRDRAVPPHPRPSRGGVPGAACPAGNPGR
jgi:hypothetical protein